MPIQLCDQFDANTSRYNPDGDQESSLQPPRTLVYNTGAQIYPRLVHVSAFIDTGIGKCWLICWEETLGAFSVVAEHTLSIQDAPM